MIIPVKCIYPQEKKCGPVVARAFRCVKGVEGLEARKRYCWLARSTGSDEAYQTIING